MQRIAVFRTSQRLFSTSRIMAQPSQVKGHARWIKGVGSEALGAIMFSSKLKASGAATKEAGIAEMRAAKEIGDKKVEARIAKQGPVGLNVEARTEGMFGKALGCEGMKERGEAKMKMAQEKIQNERRRGV